MRFVAPLLLLSLGGAARGEKLIFNAEWRFLDAGKAELLYSPDSAKLSLRTAGLADSLYAVRDQYSISFDGAFCASAAFGDSRQGKRHREIAVTYQGSKAHYVERDMTRNGAVMRDSSLDVPACVHDMLSALQVLRRTARKPGDAFTIPVSDGRKTANVKVEVQEKETIRTPAGVFPSVRYEAFVFNDVIYRRKARLLFWLSDDARRRPVQLQVKMPFWIGSVTLQLEKEEAN